MTPEILVDTAESLAETFAVRFTETAGRAIAERGQFSLALPGGSVAATFFPRLARVQVDWSRVSFFWGDERAVPPTHPDSNYAVAERVWLRPAAVPATQIHRMPADAADLEGAADAHAEELVRVLGSPPALDLALLGMGPDGHVCSLFPDHPLLQENRRWVAAIVDSPKPPPRRLTLTLPVLAAARQVVLVATGAAKAEAVRSMLRDPDSRLPAAIVLRAAGDRGVVLLDQAAAVGIKT
ncbi:MAG: 6-phosphogluconolactonase [Acidobacteria bacterium]|nr:6-phosphogluconolactonase [Acidobacteriota bacterium]MCA1648940.1 6-phosphogluconolactonase [Acidobacteriota bacterium]